MNEARPWHQLFGLSLMDFFHDLPVSVETEKDLSVRKQLLDVVLVRKETQPLARPLPDGFEDLGPHNLITFKSHQEALDGWALNELIGHYVNYRKQSSPSMQELLPEADFRLFAVSVRYPQGLARHIELLPVQPGVYDIRHFTGTLRLVVVRELPQHENNALLHLFSARADLVKYGKEHYRLRSAETTLCCCNFSGSMNWRPNSWLTHWQNLHGKPSRNSSGNCRPKNGSRGCLPKSGSGG